MKKRIPKWVQNLTRPELETQLVSTKDQLIKFVQKSERRFWNDQEVKNAIRFQVSCIDQLLPYFDRDELINLTELLDEGIMRHHKEHIKNARKLNLLKNKIKEREQVLANLVAATTVAS